jgi:hypothetical protein
MTPQKEKQLTYGIGAIAVILLAYKFLGNNNIGGTIADPTGNGTAPPGGVPGAAVFNPQRVADQLYDAMKEMGTDELDVLAILKYITEQQFALVIQKFGKKSYNASTGNQYNFSPFGSLPLVNLPGWLKSELSEEEYALLRLKYPNYL